MFNSSEQTISNGNGNVQAPGDVNINNYFQNHEYIHINVYEKDIFNVIEQFEENIDLFDGFDDNIENNDLEFDLIEKERKNELNKLSPEYFQVICDDFLPLFYKIDDFLKSPQNKEALKKYRKVACFLKHSITAKRDKFGAFEEVLDDIVCTLVRNITISGATIDAVNVVVFLNYMYWNCDIGRRK